MSTFVKVTALDGINLEARLKHDINVLLEIEQTIHHYMRVQGIIKKIDIFVESKRQDKTISVEYDILKLLLFIDGIYPNDVLEMLLLNIHQKILRLKNYEQTQFFFELATYSEYFHATYKNVIYVPLSKGNLSTTMKWLSSIEFSKNSVEQCNYSAIYLVHKTDFCPYIQMSTDELSVEIENEFLILKSHDITSKLSRFEYQLQNNSLHICLNDFIPFYYSLLTAEVAGFNCAICNFGKLKPIYLLLVNHNLIMSHR